MRSGQTQATKSPTSKDKMEFKFKKKDLKFSNATNSRNIFYKYYKIDDNKSFSVLAGRCFKCSKITDAFCDKCFKYVCKGHLVMSDEDDNEGFCTECQEKNSKKDSSE